MKVLSQKPKELSTKHPMSVQHVHPPTSDNCSIPLLIGQGLWVVLEFIVITQKWFKRWKNHVCYDDPINLNIQVIKLERPLEKPRHRWLRTRSSGRHMWTL